MVRLAFVRRNWSPTGGAEHYLRRLVTGLRPHGFHLTLICESWHSGENHFDELKQLDASGPRAFAEAANQYLHTQSFDCVFSLERGIKADIYRAGDGVHRSWLQHRSAGKPLRGWLRNQANFKNHDVLALEQVTFHPANTRHVIANSEMVVDDIRRFFDYPEDRIHLIPNGVDLEYFSSGDREAGRTAMGWGESDLVCLLVGAGPERKGHAQARNAIAKLGTRMRLAIVDQPPPCELPDLYAAADIFLLPTLYDPFANVTLEAMAAGLPVVTTESNGARMMIQSGKNGFLIAHADHTAELSAYLLALCDETIRKRIGEEAKKTAAQCDLATHIDQTVRLIRECTGNQ